MHETLDGLLGRWGVEPEGPVLRTPSSLIRFGRRSGVPVVLKTALTEEEQRGGRLLAFWSAEGGRGVAEVLEHDGAALLMRRATGTRDLVALARGGHDGAATSILAEAVERLHRSGGGCDDPGLVPLEQWFHGLVGRPQADPLLRAAAAVARRVLDATRAADVVALHGDVHHGNVLDDGHGWVAIDPKGLSGHRAFDFANLLCNPDEATALSRLDDRLQTLGERSGLEVDLLADWTLAWCGLSLSWQRGAPSWHDRATRAVAERLLARC